MLIDTFTCCLLCVPTEEMLLSYALMFVVYLNVYYHLHGMNLIPKSCLFI